MQPVAEDLILISTPYGLYAPQGDFYIDPLRPVKRALITHAHSDHARRGSQSYYCSEPSVSLLRMRLGESIEVQGFPYGERINFNGLQVSFHAAGHILGSAQIRIQRDHEVWVVSGDYKRERDPSCEPFELVHCDTFISEATFGTPQYQWSHSIHHGKAIWDWWQFNSKHGYSSVLFAYSLGKAQRVLAELYPLISQGVWIHDSMVNLTQAYRDAGINLAQTYALMRGQTQLNENGSLVLIPPGSDMAKKVLQMKNVKTAFVSGWMQTQYTARNQSFDHGFVMSDHADWNDLNRTIEETRARRVFLCHRRNGVLQKYLRKKGIDAHHISSLEMNNREQFLQLSLF